MKVLKVQSEQQLQDAFFIRKKVFVEEQKVSIEEEIDQFEDAATHFVAYSDENEVIGAARLREVDGYGKIERVCIDQSQRGTGAGKQLMLFVIDEIQSRGIKKAKLNAQTQAENFYKRLGFETISKETFLDAGIPHVTMTKEWS
ncbi:GNAT family N-acetyltransferase [Alkalihalobacillus trypoxylicola]|uniref:Acetyltransferase n=1 Tax=Alkalihalobacillus trypoxylicola TaxID=519424 RepID=A0A161Q6T8_9BACI|nr:GNAT family N-acetyltransferase [Alkalihalobacillus trypoxylicola]KYG32098.1 acetyltransferase [Alkalihalobacillus trypoxylicola]GAF66274.1 putative acetyltransferase [Bacillus sp. TS-2]